MLFQPLTSSILINPPTPTPSPVPASGCAPGRDGVPGSLVGHLLCGDWATGAPHTLQRLIGGHWPLLTAVLGVLFAAGLAWRWLHRRAWDRHAAQARWLEIIPPVTATPTATVGLWRLLATLLPAPRRWALRPPRLVWEVQANPKGMRCGLWLPPGVNPTAVLRLLQRAWPGARTEQASPPRVNGDRPTAGVSLAIARPEWQLLIDDDRPWRTTHRSSDIDGEDPLRAVYDGLASAGRTGGALLQIHVCRAPRRRVAALRRATVHPERARRTSASGALRAGGLLADGLRWLIIAVLDFVTPGPSRPRSSLQRDPYAAELARQARAKYADAPHLLIAIRATTTGPSKAAAKTAADDITSGFGLLCAHGHRRRLRRPLRSAWSRWVPEAGMRLASVVEVAAYTALPAEPSAYGLPSAASRRRSAGRDLFSARPSTTRPARPRSTPTPATGPVIRLRPAQPATTPPPAPTTGAAPGAATGTASQQPSVWRIP